MRTTPRSSAPSAGSRSATTPTSTPSDGAEQRFKELNEAYRVLSDRQRRTAYDMFGHAGVDGAAAGGFEGFGGGFGPFGDIFDAFFGGAPAGAAAPTRVVAGADLRYDLTIEFAEAVFGITKEITFPTLVDLPALRRRRRRARHRAGDLSGLQRQRRAASGGADDPGPDGEHRRLPALPRRGPHHRHAVHRVRRRWPDPRGAHAPGHDPGRDRRRAAHRARGPGRGRPARRSERRPVRGGQRSASMPQLVRRGTELYHELPVTFPQAALGATLTVPTVEGSEEVDVPAGAQSGHEIRLRGKGVPRLRGAGRGDLHVIVNVVVPTKLSKRERELLERARRGQRAGGPAEGRAIGLRPAARPALRLTRADALARAERRGRRGGGRGGQRDPRPSGGRHRGPPDSPDPRPGRRARRRATTRPPRIVVTAHVRRRAGERRDRSRPPSARSGISRRSGCARSARSASVQLTMSTGPTRGRSTTSRSASVEW